jgi:tetratricopeptide (TPR) repeat protein
VNNKYTYKAFISYSHQDAKWASWLHRAIEGYRLPRKLVGTSTVTGVVPARVRPVFRDRDELSSASDLGSTVKQALSESENLIVVCSPGAVSSHWVNEEIREFARLGRQDRIFCVIVNGEPAANGAPSTCFPPVLTQIGLQEPLAADVRKWADGKHLSKLKLVSGLLGLPLDQLRRRDLQKRQKTWALAAVASIVLAAVLISAVTSRMTAQQRRDSGESLVAYKLNELRTVLNVTEDPAHLERLGTWDQQKLSRLIVSAGQGEGALENRALELREQGTADLRTGSVAQAMQKFQDSWALLAEAYRRDRGNLSTYFELGQAEYWIGHIYKNLGEFGAAEKSLTSYAEITRQLIIQEPENSEWVLEMAYALSNLGFLQTKLDANNPERALQLLQSALEYNQIALVLDPKNEYYQSELGQSHAYLADAQRGVCDLEGALQSRMKQVALEQEMLSRDSEDIKRLRRLAVAFSGLSVVEEELGNNEGARENLVKALSLIEPALLENPDNQRSVLFKLNRKQRLLVLVALAGDIQEALTAMDELDGDWQHLRHAIGTQDEYTSFYVYFLLDRAWLSRLSGAEDMAVKWLEQAIPLITGVLEKQPGEPYSGNQMVRAAFMLWEIKQELPAQSIMTLLPDYENHSGRTRACADASMAARKAVMLGQTDRARSLTEYLINKGYRDKRFMRFCKAYSLCEER